MNFRDLIESSVLPEYFIRFLYDPETDELHMGDKDTASHAHLWADKSGETLFAHGFGAQSGAFDRLVRGWIKAPSPGSRDADYGFGAIQLYHCAPYEDRTPRMLQIDALYKLKDKFHLAGNVAVTGVDGADNRLGVHMLEDYL